MKNTSNFVEVSTDYTDENGVTHIDAYTIYMKSHQDEDAGRTIGFIIKGEVYWKDDEASTNEFVKSSIQDAIKESREASIPKKGEMYVVSVTTKNYIGDSGNSLLVDDTSAMDNIEDALNEYNFALLKEDLFSATLSAVILSTDYPTDPSMQWLADEINSKG
jgi:hypothetical protein